MSTNRKTNKSILIRIPNSQSSKAEETATLQKLTDAFKDTDSYLSMLFTQELVAWFEHQLESDIAPDIFHELETEIRAATSAENLSRVTMQDLAMLKDRFKAAVEKAQDLEKKLDAASFAKQWTTFDVDQLKARLEISYQNAAALREEIAHKDEVLKLKDAANWQLQCRVMELQAYIKSSDEMRHNLKTELDSTKAKYKAAKQELNRMVAEQRESEDLTDEELDALDAHDAAEFEAEFGTD